MSTSELGQLLQVLFQGNLQSRSSQRHAKTSYFTVEEIEELGDIFNLPLPSDLLQVLDVGVRQGTFLRCVVDGTQYTGSKQFEYAYNPDMLRVNPKNSLLLNPRCLSAHTVTGTVVTSANNRAPCYRFRGSLNGGGTGEQPASSYDCHYALRPPLSANVIQSISKCCGQ